MALSDHIKWPLLLTNGNKKIEGSPLAISKLRVFEAKVFFSSAASMRVADSEVVVVLDLAISSVATVTIPIMESADLANRFIFAHRLKGSPTN